MDKIFYAILNKERQEFLSLYEDGEGNEYHSAVEFAEINNGGIFETKERAENVLNEARRFSRHSRVMHVENASEFLRDCVIVEISIKFVGETA